MRPSLGHKAPGSLSQGSNRQVLPVVESFPGARLLLGQRSRMNLFSHHVRSLLHQDRRNSRTEFAGYRDNGDSGSNVSRMRAANRAVKLSKLTILSDGRPGSLDELRSNLNFSPK